MPRNELFSGIIVYRSGYDPGFVVHFDDGRTYYVCDPDDKRGPAMVEAEVLIGDKLIDEAEYTDELWMTLLTALLTQE